MVKRVCVWTIAVLAVMAVSGRTAGESAQESLGFSSNTPYTPPPPLTESERKNIIKVAVGDETASQPSPVREAPSGPGSGSGSKPAVADRAEPAELPLSPLEGQTVGRPAPRGPETGEKGALSTESGTGSWFFARYLGSLLVVIGLIVLLAWLYYRLSPMRRATVGAVQVLWRTPVNSRQSICLVKVGGRLLVVGLSAGHMTTLDTIDDPAEVARLIGTVESDQPHSISSGLQAFRNVFRHEQREYEADDDPIVDYDESGGSSWQDARDELAGLLRKVKGLGCIRPKS